jgi:hypothetical protein
MVPVATVVFLSALSKQKQTSISGQKELSLIQQSL